MNPNPSPTILQCISLYSITLKMGVVKSRASTNIQVKCSKHDFPSSPNAWGRSRFVEVGSTPCYARGGRFISARAGAMAYGQQHGGAEK